MEFLLLFCILTKYQECDKEFYWNFYITEYTEYLMKGSSEKQETTGFSYFRPGAMLPWKSDEPCFKIALWPSDWH